MNSVAQTLYHPTVIEVKEVRVQDRVEQFSPQIAITGRLV